MVQPNGAWLSKAPKGWLYKDKSALEDGVQQVKIKPGVEGKSSIKLKARGVNVPMPLPAGATFFEQSPKVSVHLHNVAAESLIDSCAPRKRVPGFRFFGQLRDGAGLFRATVR